MTLEEAAKAARALAEVLGAEGAKARCSSPGACASGEGGFLGMCQPCLSRFVVEAADILEDLHRRSKEASNG